MITKSVNRSIAGTRKRYSLPVYVLAVIVSLSFTFPYFLSGAYKFCPSNPQNGFVCYCIYKQDANKSKNANDLVYSSGAKKQIDNEKLNLPGLFTEDPYELPAESASEKIIIVYKPFYKGIQQAVPDRPPVV